MQGRFMVVDPEKDFLVLKGLSSPTRIRILKLLHENGPTKRDRRAAGASAIVSLMCARWKRRD